MFVTMMVVCDNISIIKLINKNVKRLSIATILIVLVGIMGEFFINFYFLIQKNEKNNNITINIYFYNIFDRL